MSKLLTTKKARKVKNADEFIKELTKLSDAAIGVVFVRTREPYRAQDSLYEWAIQQNKDFKVWTILSGWQSYAVSGEGSEAIVNGETVEIDTSRPISKDGIISMDKALLKVSETFPNDGCYVVMNGHPFLEGPYVKQFIKQHVQDALNSDKRLIWLVPDWLTVPQELEDDVYVLDYKTPSHKELKLVWDDHKLSLEKDCLTHFKNEDVDLIIQNSIGMTAMEFDSALAIAFVENKERLSSKHDNPITPQEIINVIMKAKVEVIKKTDILELMPPATMDEVGGLDNLKHWLQMRTGAFTEEAQEFGVDQPKGMLVVGPPGCGKSLVAKATSSVLNIPCIKLDIGRVFQQFVGQSEQRMRSALNQVEGMAPCVLFIDEVDKGLGGAMGGGDSGTTSRVFGTLLTWLQERDNSLSPIFVIMTANNVIGLPPELMRRGRLDEIFAVTFPNVEERKTILRIHVEKRGHSLPDDAYTQIAEHTHDFVGAELEAVVKDAITTCFYSGSRELTANHIINEAKAIVPLSKAFADKVSAMAKWAEDNAKPASSGKYESITSAKTTTSYRRGGRGGKLTSDGVRRPKRKGLTDN